MLRRKIGPQRWDHTGITSMPEAEYRAHEKAADEEFDAIVNGIDWNRVLLEASGRHVTLHDENDDPAMRDVCGECVRSALLTWDRNVPWTDTDPGRAIGSGMAPVADQEAARREHRDLQRAIKPQLQANEEARRMPGAIA
jgi:hypothetical protein